MNAFPSNLQSFSFLDILFVFCFLTICCGIVFSSGNDSFYPETFDCSAVMLLILYCSKIYIVHSRSASVLDDIGHRIFLNVNRYVQRHSLFQDFRFYCRLLYHSYDEQLRFSLILCRETVPINNGVQIFLLGLEIANKYIRSQLSICWSFSCRPHSFPFSGVTYAI